MMIPRDPSVQDPFPKQVSIGAIWERRRRQFYLLVATFLGLSAFLCLGSYMGWFAWKWGRPKPETPPVVAEGSEAEAFLRRLMMSEAKFAREDVRELRRRLAKMDTVKDIRYGKYAEGKRAPEPLGSLAVANPTSEEAEAVHSDLDEQDMIQVYETARLLDRRLHHVYRMFRTCELARIQDLTLSEAYEVTGVVAPSYPDVDMAAFRARISTTASPEALRVRDQITMMKVGIKSMVSAAIRMMDLAAIIEPWLRDGTSKIEIAAGENPQMFDIVRRIGGPPKIYVGTSGTEPNAFVSEWGDGDGPVTKKNLDLPIDPGSPMGEMLPLPGRKLMKEGRQRDWMFINSWYVIGPFPNPKRKNLDKKFPPETSLDPHSGFVGIDLDVTYQGLDKSRPLRWEFVSSDNRVCFVPNRAVDEGVWYAYTEIWSESEQEKYCIFGSDDSGKCWISGEEVFVSGVTPHPWIPDRKWEKVRFGKGFNPVLFRLENAWGDTGFSLCIYTGEETKSESSGPGPGSSRDT